MAIVDRTRELEQREQRPIGWDGRTALEMLTESERRFAQTGRYWGLDPLPLREQTLYTCSTVRSMRLPSRAKASRVLAVCSPAGPGTVVS